MARLPLVVLALVSCLAVAAGSGSAEEKRKVPFERTEQRADCASYDALRQPFFGATHLHTGMSFDASIRFVPSRPRDAYNFAKGLAPIIGVDPSGRPTRTYKIDRVLDWGAVTDHSEHFAEMGICKSEDHKGRYSFDCQLINGFYWQPGVHQPPALQRSNANSAFSMLVLPNNGPSSLNTHLPLCTSGEGDCPAAELEVWREMQAAAEEAYDRTSKCAFTSFIGYEVTSTPSGTNWHRNVIFRNDHVLERPITAIDMAREKNQHPNQDAPLWLGPPDVGKLWDGLRTKCIEAGTGCDALTIPHNSNLGGGVQAGNVEIVPPMFFDPPSAAEAERRQRFEPLVEIYQDKGSSECRFDPRFGTGVETTDEHCDFELLDSGSILSASGVGNSGDSSSAPPPSSFNERAYVRNVLKDGLAFLQKLGVNPFKLGVVSASDSHDGTMGWHPENESFGGHLGIEDAIPVRSASTIQNSSGGYSVAWAEENSRDAIFTALKRRETYGTSGTRIVVRFFGGWDFAPDACRTNFVATGYAHGVPMGGDLPAKPSAARAPRFVVAAWMDDFIGTPLQRIQLVKGWVDKSGQTHEQVWDVAGGPNGAGVNPETCERVGKGAEQLCGVFEDPQFDATQPAFYYVRVLENPVCRYSTHWCRKEFGVNPLSTSCANQLKHLQATDPAKAVNASVCCSNETTSPYVQPVIQERAWTSPIWFSPAGS